MLSSVKKGSFLIMKNFGKFYAYQRVDKKPIFSFVIGKDIGAETEADARAKLWLWLKKEGNL